MLCLLKNTELSEKSKATWNWMVLYSYVSMQIIYCVPTGRLLYNILVACLHGTHCQVNIGAKFMVKASLGTAASSSSHIVILTVL